MVKLKHTESYYGSTTEVQVRYNQSGYVGQSMSVRAKNAYDAGEMPKTKWTKSAIMDVLYTMFGEAASGFNRYSRQDLLDNLCTYSSWHHTGKYANATNFYTIDRNTALLFADKNNIESMRDIIENDEEYSRDKSDRERMKKLQDQENNDEKRMMQRRIDYVKQIYHHLPSLFSSSLSDIKEETHKGNPVHSFEFMMPNQYRLSIHAYEDDYDSLNKLYNDLKSKKENKDTKDIRLYVCSVCCMSIIDGYDNLKKDEYGVLLGDGNIYKDFNIRQLPLYKYNSVVEQALN